MGSEVRGPGTEGPGLPHVAAPVARAWAVAAATAAVRVPAGNAEADAWTVRGWADVAIGCVALDGPGFAGPSRRLVRHPPGRKLYSRKSCIDRHPLSSYTKLIDGAHVIRDGQRPG